MGINQWWDGDPAERYWLETTDRADLGVDLKAPQLDDHGAANWSYALVNEVCDGDIVFHYQLDRGAIAAWSRAVGGSWAEDIVWGSHAAGADAPRQRPGWRHGLEGPYPLANPLDLASIRAAEAQLREARAGVKARTSGAAYFPFEVGDRRRPRPTQFYLTKFPASLVAAFPVLAQAAGQQGPPGQQPPAQPRSRAARPAAPLAGLGQTYRPAAENVATSTRNPWTVDPDVVDRGLRGHATTQNALAAYVRALGCEPRSPAPDEPQFDLAWSRGEIVCVAEVKSLTRRNEEQQLRLGLGQVLRYRQWMADGATDVRAYLVVERAPSDETWTGLCAGLGVILTWPAALYEAEWP